MPITQYYTKRNVSFHEYQMYKYVYDLSANCEINVPKFITYNIDSHTLVTEKIPNMSISDFYGESFLSVNNNTVDKIRETISILYQNHIVYPDITGYNFIEYDGGVWIIDFEHAHFTTNTKNMFVEKFIAGLPSWNPLFE
jgi:tRNA A-37 threonylcarbamoyl transferase component Bud32